MHDRFPVSAVLVLFQAPVYNEVHGIHIMSQLGGRVFTHLRKATVVPLLTSKEMLK